MGVISTGNAFGVACAVLTNIVYADIDIAGILVETLFVIQATVFNGFKLAATVFTRGRLARVGWCTVTRIDATGGAFFGFFGGPCAIAIGASGHTACVAQITFGCDRASDLFQTFLRLHGIPGAYTVVARGHTASVVEVTFGGG